MGMAVLMGSRTIVLWFMAAARKPHHRPLAYAAAAMGSRTIALWLNEYPCIF